MDASGMLAGASLLSKPAEEFENDAAIEEVWAQKAFEYSMIHFNIICSADPKYLKLTPVDDELYKIFRNDFPKMNIAVVNEDEMKSPSGKMKWREFIEKVKGKVEDSSFGTLLRTNCNGEYSNDNTILVPRVQFYAIEIARNREGYNDKLRGKFRFEQ